MNELLKSRSLTQYFSCIWSEQKFLLWQLWDVMTKTFQLQPHKSFEFKSLNDWLIIMEAMFLTVQR